MTEPSKQVQLFSLHYRAYLVRLWRDDVHEPWRASAQSVQGGELVRFATIQELFVFLEVPTTDAPLTKQIDTLDQ